MRTICENSFSYEGRFFATSRGLEREPFIKTLLINSGVLTPLGKLNTHFAEDHGEHDPLRGLSRLELHKAAMDAFYPGPGKRQASVRPDGRILNRMLYEVDSELFDQMRHWDLWAANDGAHVVSDLTIKRFAKAKRDLDLTNPWGQGPDHPWDRPNGDPDFTD